MINNKAEFGDSNEIIGIMDKISISHNSYRISISPKNRNNWVANLNFNPFRTGFMQWFETEFYVEEVRIGKLGSIIKFRSETEKLDIISDYFKR